jgi:hypothetical protein
VKPIEFFLAAFFLFAIAGAALTLWGCGGTEFTIADSHPDAGQIPETLTSAEDAHGPDTGGLPYARDGGSSPLGSTDAETVEKDVGSPDAEIPETSTIDVKSCDVSLCKCPINEQACCTGGGQCGCGVGPTICTVL